MTNPDQKLLAQLNPNNVRATEKAAQHIKSPDELLLRALNTVPEKPKSEAGVKEHNIQLRGKKV